jgi:hypothetical protein
MREECYGNIDSGTPTRFRSAGTMTTTTDRRALIERQEVLYASAETARERLEALDARRWGGAPG